MNESPELKIINELYEAQDSKGTLDLYNKIISLSKKRDMKPVQTDAFRLVQEVCHVLNLKKAKSTSNEVDSSSLLLFVNETWLFMGSFHTDLFVVFDREQFLSLFSFQLKLIVNVNKGIVRKDCKNCTRTSSPDCLFFCSCLNLNSFLSVLRLDRGLGIVLFHCFFFVYQNYNNNNNNNNNKYKKENTKQRK